MGTLLSIVNLLLVGVGILLMWIEGINLLNAFILVVGMINFELVRSSLRLKKIEERLNETERR